MDSLIIAVLTGLGFWLLVLTTPQIVRMHIMWFSWFVDVGFAALLILIFHGSTQGMIIACLGALTITCCRLLTLVIDKKYGRRPLPPWHIITEGIKKIHRGGAARKDQRDRGETKK